MLFMINLRYEIRQDLVFNLILAVVCYPFVVDCYEGHDGN